MSKIITTRSKTRFALSLGAAALVLGAVAAVPLGMALRLHPRVAGIGPADPSPGTSSTTGYLAGAYQIPNFSTPTPFDTTVPGGLPVGFCVTPGAASPNQFSAGYTASTAYTNPQGASFTNNGGDAWMMYWAQAVDTWGSWTDQYGNTWSANNVADAVASILSQNAGDGDFYTGVNGMVDYYGPGPANGSTASAEQLPNEISALSVHFEGPWTLSVAITDAATGAPVTSLSSGTDYNATVTLTSASGNRIPGVALTSPPVGGTFSSTVAEPTNVAWQGGGTTNSNGQAVLQFNYSGSLPNVAVTFNVLGAGNSTADGGPGGPLFAVPPSTSGGQALMVAGAQPVGTFAIEPMGTASKPPTAQIQIHKQVAGTAANVLSPSAEVSATFTITGNGQPPQTLVVSKGDLTPTSGQLQLGTYTVTETVPPPGQQVAPPQTVTLTSANTTTPLVVSFSDPAKPGALTIQKKNGYGQPLAGVQFVVVEGPVNGNGTCAPISSGNPANAVSNVTVKGCSTPVSTDAFATGVNGCVNAPGFSGTSSSPCTQNPTLGSLSPDWYTVQEVAAPTGYQSGVGQSDYVAVYPEGNTGTVYPAAVSFVDHYTSSISTAATATATTGSAITDTATLNASAGATGTVTFSLYGPLTSLSAVTGTACNGTPVFTSTPVTVAGPGSYAPATGYTPTTPGVYAWVATYSGDANNSPAFGVCGASGEESVVTSLSTAALPIAISGAKITDTATVGGPSDLTGSLTFAAYGPFASATGNTCTTPVFTSAAVPVTKPGVYDMTGTYVPAKTGLYDWVATFTGSGPYAAVSDVGTCGATGESSIDFQITTTATASPGASTTSLADSATVTGPSEVTGSLTFSVYGPFTSTTGNTCTTSDFTSKPVSVTGPGTYPMPGSYTPSKPGIYDWVDNFTGSGAMAGMSASGRCGAAGEVVGVSALTTQVSSPTASTGQQLSDTVTLTGAVPTGTLAPITWKLYGPIPPTNGACTGVSWTGAPVFATGTFTPTGAANQKTPAAPPVTAPGCYSFAESWPQDGATLAGYTSPGVPSEVTLVSAAGGGQAAAGGGGISIQTDEGLWTPPAASASVLPSGPVGTGVTLVLIIGMLVMALLAILWQKRRRLSNWLAAAAVLIGAFLFIATVFTGTVSSATTSSGYDVAHPAVAPPPVHPSSPGAIQAATEVGGPPTLVIPALGVSAPVLAEGVTVVNGQRSLTIPNDIHDVGVYTAPGVPLPGDPGVAIIAGHIDSAAAGPGALYHLSELRPGDSVIVANVGGRTTHWTVTSTPEVMSKANLAHLSWPTSGPPYLAIVTCGGPFDYSTGHYLDNVVVYAAPAT